MINRICDYGTIGFIGVIIGLILGLMTTENLNRPPIAVIMNDGTSYMVDSLSMPVNPRDGTVVDLYLTDHRKIQVPQPLIRSLHRK